MHDHKPVGAYRIYNIELGKEGEVFYYCSVCYKKWYDAAGYKFIINKIADNAIRECETF